MIREIIKRRLEIGITLLLLVRCPALSVIMAYAMSRYWYKQTRNRLKRAQEFRDKREMQVGFVMRYIVLIMVMQITIRLDIFVAFVISFLTYYVVGLYELMRGGIIWKK